MALDSLDPTRVPLPNGTKVTTRVDRLLGQRRIVQGSVGQVVDSAGDEVTVRLPDGTKVRYLRSDLVPTKSGQLRFAIRRERAWRALRPCVVLDTVVGSRAWGLSDAQSDIDRRGIFVLPFPWTTSLLQPPSELISANGSETYWEIEKAIRQALRADPNTLETLFLDGVTASDPLGEAIITAREAFVSREIYGSFGRYALSQLKKLRQSLRLAQSRAEVFRWLREDPSLELDAVAARLATTALVEAPTEADRRHRAKAYVKQLYASLYDQGLIASRDFATLVRYAATTDPSLETPRHLRPKNAYNLLRLLKTATIWLREGTPQFVLDEPTRARLLAIKRGEVSLDEVLSEAESMVPELEAARADTSLPEKPDLRRADELLRHVRQDAARRWYDGAGGPFGCDAPAMPKPEEEQQP